MNEQVVGALIHTINVGIKVVAEHDAAGDQESEAVDRCRAVAFAYEALGVELFTILERAVVVPAVPIETDPGNPGTFESDGESDENAPNEEAPE